MMYFKLEDSTTENVPQLLHLIVERIKQDENKPPESLQKEIFYTLILVILLENGFTLIDQDIEVKNFDEMFYQKLITQSGVFQCNFILNGFRTLPLKILITPLGSAMLTNIVITDLCQDTYSICLPTSRYIVSPHASTVPLVFRDLKHLSITFKNKVLSAVKSRVLREFGYPSASLIGLPDEILFKIILMLGIKDCLNLRETCTRMLNFLNEPSSWHELYNRDFDKLEYDENVDWQSKYIETYKEKHIPVQIIRAGTMHDYMDYSDYVSYADPSMWNEII